MHSMRIIATEACTVRHAIRAFSFRLQFSSRWVDGILLVSNSNSTPFPHSLARLLDANIWGICAVNLKNYSSVVSLNFIHKMDKFIYLILLLKPGVFLTSIFVKLFGTNLGDKKKAKLMREIALCI